MDEACMVQVEATNELGDVHAHLGQWPEAVQAWSDALDCLTGPYQVSVVYLLASYIANLYQMRDRTHVCACTAGCSFL